MCEPGRALVAEAELVIVRVTRAATTRSTSMTAPSALVRRRLFGFRFPVKLIPSSRRKLKPLADFALYGPTCDSDDHLPGPFVLPDCVREGDYIEIGQIGAYGRVLANRFNGFGEYDEVMLTDEPMLSMYGENADAEEQSGVMLKSARA